MSAFLYKHQKVITVILAVIFIISLVPILMLAGYDCASGDDYNYGAGAHLAFLATGSVLQAFRAAAQTTIGTWHGWQGTWFDCFLFCLHPEVFSESGYVIVPYIFVMMQILTVMLFAYHFIRGRLEISGLYWIEVALIWVIFAFQLVPSRKSAFFWWVGCIHYVMPFCLSLIGIILGDRFLSGHKRRDMILLTVVAACIGGATYPAVLLLVLSVFLLWLARFVLYGKKDVRDLQLLIPFSAVALGLGISIIAPGNAVRSASDMGNGGVDSGGGIATVFKSIAFSVTDAFSFISEKPYVLLAFIAVFVLSLQVLKKQYQANEQVFVRVFDHPLIFVLVMFMLNAAMYAPRIYAGGVVSSGYLNFNFCIFFTCVISSIIYIQGFCISRGYFIRIALGVKYFVLAVIVVTIFYLGRHGIKETTDYECLSYYLSGQAHDYREQIKLQRVLMQEEGIDDVIVPEINDYQGPLMHMPIVADPENVDNVMTSSFYGKKSCRSIPRSEWIEKYGKKYEYFEEHINEKYRYR